MPLGFDWCSRYGRMMLGQKQLMIWIWH